MTGTTKGRTGTRRQRLLPSRIAVQELARGFWTERPGKEEPLTVLAVQIAQLLELTGSLETLCGDVHSEVLSQ
jgi:hypothetical protein